jgi:hypothetical protein
MRGASAFHELAPESREKRLAFRPTAGSMSRAARRHRRRFGAKIARFKALRAERARSMALFEPKGGNRKIERLLGYVPARGPRVALPATATAADAMRRQGASLHVVLTPSSEAFPHQLLVAVWIESGTAVTG